MQGSPFWRDIIVLLEREASLLEHDEPSTLRIALALLCWNIVGDVARARKWASREHGGADRLTEMQQQLVRAEEAPESIGTVDSPNRRATLHSALAAIRTVNGQLDAAVDAAHLALDIRPDVLAMAVLANASRQRSDPNNLRALLQQQMPYFRSPANKATCLLELAWLADDHEQAKELLQQAEQLYAGSKPDLAGTLATSPATPTQGDPSSHELSAYWTRAAAVLSAHGQQEQAHQAYRDAFALDPGNREAFTAYETSCLARELWREAIEIYDAAIRHAEQQSSSPYRLADLHCRRANLQLERLGQPGEAAASLFRALDDDPKSEAVMTLLKSVFAREQDWLGLIRAYEHRASLLPDNELFRQEMLRLAAREAAARLPNSSPEARRLWEKVARLDPDDQEALVHLQVAYERGGPPKRLAEVLEARARLVESSETALQIHLQLARICEKQLDDPERAIRAYEGVRAIDANHEETLRALGRIYEATEQWQRCVEVLKDLALIEAHPEQRSLLYFRCGSIMEACFADDDAAAEYYRASLAQASGCLPALHGLRDVYSRQEKWQDVLRTLSDEIELWSGTAEQAGVLARIAGVYLQHLGDKQRAVDFFERALAADANCRPALQALFDIEYSRTPMRALELSDRLAHLMHRGSTANERNRLLYRRGLLLRDCGAYAEAAQHLASAAALDTSYTAALDALISLCRQAPDAFDFAATFRELEQHCKESESASTLAHLRVAAGTLAELAGDADIATRRYSQAMQAAMNDVVPLRAMVNLQLRLGRPLHAAQTLRTFIFHATDAEAQTAAYLLLGDVFSDAMLQPADAARVYEEALKLYPSCNRAAFRLAQEFYAQGLIERARARMAQLVNEITDSDPEGQQAAYHHYLAAILLRLGSKEAALRGFAKALDIDPTCHRAASALARQLALSARHDEAEKLLRETTKHVLSRAGAGDRSAADALQRTRADIRRKSGNVAGAVALYEKLALRETATLEDRITLAELRTQLEGGRDQAVAEIQQVVSDDPLEPRALTLLERLYRQTGQHDRASRCQDVLQIVEPTSSTVAQRSLRYYSPDTEGRMRRELHRLLRARQQDEHVERLWNIIKDLLDPIFPLDLQGEEPTAIESSLVHPFCRSAQTTCALLGLSVNLEVADAVSTGVLIDDRGAPRVIIDRLFEERPEVETAFALGWGLGLLLGGHSLISRLALDDRELLVQLLSDLLEPPVRRGDLASEFIRQSPAKKAQQTVDLALNYQSHIARGGQPDSAVRWLSTIDSSANRYGLFACDDIAVALRMITLLTGQQLALGPHGQVPIRSVRHGTELIQYYLSDAYAALRRKLAGS